MKHFVFGRTNAAHIQFFRYFFVGGSATVVDFIAYSIALYFFGTYYLIANVISFIFGLAWNHTLSILWVFESKHNRLKEITMVTIISLLGLLWVTILLYIFVEYGGLNEIIAKAFTTIVVLFWNFGMRKFLVFH